MDRRKRGEMPAELMRAQNRFQAWRRKRKPRTRISEPLWALAVKLVPAYGLNRTASALKLDYYSLKRRVQATTGSQQSAGLQHALGPAFLELASPITLAKECIMEFQDDTGTSMRVHLRGYDASDVAAVGRSFRNAQ